MAKKITDTPAWNNLVKLKEALESVADQENMPDTAHLKKQVDFISERFLRVDADLAPAPLLNDFGSNLGTVHSQITALASDRNRQHVKQATNSLSGAFQQLMVLPALESSERIQESFTEILLDAKQAADASVDNISKRSKELETTIAKLQEQAGGLAAEIQSSKERTDSLIAEYQKQFSDNENARSKRFEFQIAEINKEAEEHKAELDQHATTARDDLEQKSKVLLEAMQARDKQTKNLARAMGATGVSTTFQATANKNQLAADILRMLAIALLVGMVAIIIIALWNAPEANFETTLIRFLAAILISIPATYLARESSHQRAEAVRSRRIEIELAALGPFIEPLDGNAKAELRKQLVETYFGRAFDKDEGAEGEKITLGGNLIDFVKTAKDIVKR